MHKIKIAVVDDHEPYRKGIRQILATRVNMSVVLEASSGTEFVQRLAILKTDDLPDILLLDFRMPEMNGVETVNWLKAEMPQIKIIMISMFDNFELVLQFLKLGVSGYVTKASDASELFEAIRMVMEKGFYYSAFIAEKVIESMRNGKIQFRPDDVSGQIKAVADSLTKTEKLFLKYACTGLRTNEIAEKMSITGNTVEVHRSNVFRKMNVGSSVNMVILAIRYGMVDLN
jgi:two-component system, NarL family, invasion response regulator UvrY